jgi:hypothetical protein
MEVIVPAAGLSTRFPNMPPKYMLEDINGKLMIENAIQPYIGKYPITIIILREHEIKYNVTSRLFDRLGNNIGFKILETLTRGPADTVSQLLVDFEIEDSILIKDCDSYFNHMSIDDNYLCVEHMPQANRQLSNKSFCVIENDYVKTVVEKAIVSRYYNVGGYKFNSILQYQQAYSEIFADNEHYISAVINKSIEQGHRFKIVTVTDYVDVGTIDEWNNRRLICPRVSYSD